MESKFIYWYVHLRKVTLRDSVIRVCTVGLVTRIISLPCVHCYHVYPDDYIFDLWQEKFKNAKKNFVCSNAT
jgi:hypothetical protein